MKTSLARYTRRLATVLALMSGATSTISFAQDAAPLPTQRAQVAVANEGEGDDTTVDEIAFTQPTPAQPSAPNQPPTLPQTDVVAEPPQVQPPFNPGDAVNIPSILQGSIFSAPPINGYRADSSVTGSIIDIPNIRFPGTVNTISRDLRHDQQALRMDDVLRDIGGAVKTGGDNLRPDQFFIRGLEVTSYNYRKNGFLDPTYTPRDFANVERIDVLKGPASIAYGAAQPAGTVNLITKKPLQDRFADGWVTFGSFGLQRYQVDVNSTNQSGDILYRVNGAFEDRDSFREFGFQQRTFVAPSISWVLTDDTIVTWEGEFLYDRQRTDSGTIAVNGDSRVFPINRYYGDPGDRRVYRDFRSTLSMTTQLNDDWTAYIGGTTLFYDAPGNITTPTPLPLGMGVSLPAPGTFYQGGPLTRTRNSATLFAEQNHAIIANLSGQVTGFFNHNIVVGTEQDWFVVNHDQFQTSIPGVDPLLIFDPSQPGPFPTGPVSTSFTFDNPGYRQNRHALYMSDYVDITEKLKLLYGVRWDHVNQTYTRGLTFAGNPVFGPATTKQTFDQGTPRVGLVYEQIPDVLSYYALYTTSFNPAGGGIFGPALGTVKPELGRIFEGGIKTNLLDDLTLTLGGFYIERQNVATQLQNFTIIQADQQRSQGVEANLVGQWTDRLSTVSNYTYSDVLQSDASGVLNGRVRGIPFHSGNVWTRYNFVQNRNTTLGVGLGWVHVGKRRGDYLSPLVLNGYDRWDLGGYGRVGRWDLASYVENVFNARYEVGSINQFQVFPGAPANFRITAGTTF